MNKQTIIDRYFSNCEKLHQTWCELPTDIRNFLVTEGVSNHDNEQNKIALEHFKQSSKTLERADYDSCNVKADDFNFASSVKSFVKYKLYSYGSHFPIVIFDIINNAYYLNYTRYSSSTGSHQSAAFRSVPAGSKVLYCDFVAGSGSNYSLPLLGYRDGSGDIQFRTDENRCFESFDALLAHREEIKKQRKFEIKRKALGDNYTVYFSNVISPLISDNCQNANFSDVKKLLKKWIISKMYIRYGIFDYMFSGDNNRMRNRLESVFLWDWFVKYKLYSYGSHFPVVVFNVMTNTYYLNHTRYSSSTGKHQAAAFNSIPDRANVIHCDFVGGNGHGYSLPLIGYKNDSGDMCYKLDDSRCFSSFDALLAHRKETEKARKFEFAAEKYFRTFSDDFMNVINPLIGDNTNSGDFSQVKKLIKKWINQKRFIKYGTFERISRYKYFIDRLESVFLWDWFVKETNKSIRKYADGLQVA